MLDSAPGTKGTSCDFVAGRVIAAIEKNLGEVNAAELPLRIMARFGGVAPELAARLAAEEGIHRVGRPSDPRFASPSLSTSPLPHTVNPSLSS